MINSCSQTTQLKFTFPAFIFLYNLVLNFIYNQIVFTSVSFDIARTAIFFKSFFYYCITLKLLHMCTTIEEWKAYEVERAVISFEPSYNATFFYLLVNLLKQIFCPNYIYPLTCTCAIAIPPHTQTYIWGSIMENDSGIYVFSKEVVLILCSQLQSNLQVVDLDEDCWRFSGNPIGYLGLKEAEQSRYDWWF